MTVFDLFAGPGGWDVAAHELGLRPVGIENDQAACATRRAARLATLRRDVTTLAPPSELIGLIASPPCQDFSQAGKQAGRDGERGQLVDLVPEWVRSGQPEWVACEQVPPVLPIWEEHARQYAEWGYSTWCGILNAADYGVPQTRKRAILIASRRVQVEPPRRRYSEHPDDGGMFYPATERWVAMADALGRTFIGDQAWANTRPATTIVSSFAPDVVSPPGYRRAGDGPRQNQPGAIKITEREALILQSFPPDYPVKGARSKRFQQIGNAVPPLLARRILEVVL